MIASEHTLIRTADPDDADFLLEVYRTGRPKAALLDPRREPVLPNRDELAEMLGSKDAGRNQFFAVEDRAGCVRGFCGLRGVSIEAVFSEIMVLLIDEADHAGPIGRETVQFLLDRAFGRMHLDKVLGTCLDSEPELRALLAGSGFVSEGIQRQVLYSGGDWHDIETMTRLRAVPGTGE
jgi:RimJ/RimL family protein N-acetyltransferase